MMTIARSFSVSLVALVLLACSDDLQVTERLLTAKNRAMTPAPATVEKTADNPQAQFELASQLRAENDLVSSVEWFSTCANAGHEPCIRELGYAYLQGAGVKPDPYLGLELLQESLDEDDTTMLNDLAWFMATSKVSGIRNPERALELMGLLQQNHELDAMSADTLAAAQAATGRFSQAAKTQRQALNLLLREGRLANNMLSNYRSRLKLYQDGRAYME